MTRMETRGERLARAHTRHRWIEDDPNPQYGRLDILDGLPRTEGTEMPKRETYVEPPVSYAPFWLVVIVCGLLLSSCAVALGIRWVVGL
ncbi:MULTISPECIES: hypothetical protein [unclassified Cryobacterium]|uniref:hypothetical protein n=1 Tax=unclassified Cryobacterium TaxID=2649013 RepID=UPI00106C6878|nr:MULTISPECIES: hypothetical protein [unclassified Cryobacterium]TFC59460.1 hypothetical protein E3O68_00745 [Cryobacterium sp. TMB3-1-2]TFC67256.1 hypothetical protein E3T21_17440 [Cryobacterium sp. TMB3-15]TFC73231.1 hypothetical protein E3T22_16615 [Cryobacterium sp. TMB3-10]TFD46119.1 hypothetical protein E3T58_01250 [Cryobacterium sp. TMB3-12]